MRVGIYTLGCKVNTYESEFIKSLFISKGYEIAGFNDKCDIYVINTCTVTNNSDRKSRKIINRARKNNKGAIVVAIGCHIQYSKDFNNIDIAIGNYNKSMIVSYVEDYLINKKQIIAVRDMNDVDFEDMEIEKYEHRTRAFVKIEDGCNNFCSYCIIPYVRGRCRSKEFDKVLDEINTLVKNDYKEIVLTGIHTGNYGRDINTCFSNLLEAILENKYLERLRISSIEITELDDKFLHLLENKVLCNHLHIPLQAGSDKILKLMNRKYDKNYFRNELAKIRKVRPDIAITTDIIVGFPDETDEDFNDTLEFAREINFSKIHVFPYSKRDGTVAAKMKNQIGSNIKKERVNRLIDLSDKLEKEYYKKFINQELDVLIEKNIDGYSYGHTSNYLNLKIVGNLEPNTIHKITISEEMFNNEE
ncbi:MAG TPA: tRNA (N(6)-L-threonylcarbamoyladenosine(37)-C(2))-methylthiotransferase MtaB [Bacilli bacterium]|nr:tRNA (N(6)-L-threonylcarbamoyladenosine(37)-C(2))-methylthiotransferase MtaB [Bacilli bacterium]